MFSIYNETNTPMELINLNTDKMVILKKPVVINDNYNKSIDIKLSKKIIFNTPMDILKLQTKLASSINTKEPISIIDLELSTIFNRTDFSPFVLCTKSDKAMGVISINLDNRKVIGLNKTACFIFEHICTKKELSLFVSINNEDSPLVITVYDKCIDKVIKYVFNNRGGKIVLSTDISEVTDRRMLNLKMKKKYTIGKFRPARSTYNVLSLPNKQFPEIINTDLYNIIEFDSVSDSLDEIYNNLVINKISAITIYTEGMTQTQVDKSVEKAEKYMSIVYTMNKDAKITRHKVK